MNKLFVNKNLFFLIEDGKILVWNYKDHEQYLIEPEYFTELIKISQSGSAENNKIQEDLYSANIISREEPNSISWGWDELSKIFHIGTKNPSPENFNETNDSEKSFVENYRLGCENLQAMPNLFTARNGKHFPLPKPNIAKLDETSFYSTLKNRKTCRNFLAKACTLTDLSTILFTTFGLIHGEEWEDFSKHGLQQTAIRKASPASGGLHVEEAYVVVNRVTDTGSGLYHYDVKNHSLALISLGDFEQDVIQMNCQQFYSHGLSFGVYISARFDKSWWKYKHSRAYSAVMMDIGHVSQTFQLSATALGFNTWLTGNFVDHQVEKFLGIDGLNESAILFVGAGIGTNETFSKKMIGL